MYYCMLEHFLSRVYRDAYCSIIILAMINDFSAALFADMFIQKRDAP